MGACRARRGGAPDREQQGTAHLNRAGQSSRGGRRAAPPPAARWRLRDLERPVQRPAGGR